MRVLLDENVPVELAGELPDHEVVHVRDRGWKGFSNGELLRRAVEGQFDVLLTGDTHLPQQQNLSGFDLAVVQIRPHRLVIEEVRAMVPAIADAILTASRGTVTVVTPGGGA